MVDYLWNDIWEITLVQVLEMLCQGLQKQGDILGLVKSGYDVAKHGAEAGVIGTEMNCKIVVEQLKYNIGFFCRLRDRDEVARRKGRESKRGVI